MENTKMTERKAAAETMTAANPQKAEALWGFKIPGEDVLDPIWGELASVPASDPNASGILPAKKGGEYFVIGLDEKQVRDCQELCQEYFSAKCEIGGTERVPTSPKKIQDFKATLFELSKN